MNWLKQNFCPRQPFQKISFSSFVLCCKSGFFSCRLCTQVSFFKLTLSVCQLSVIVDSLLQFLNKNKILSNFCNMRSISYLIALHTARKKYFSISQRIANDNLFLKMIKPLMLTCYCSLNTICKVIQQQRPAHLIRQKAAMLSSHSFIGSKIDPIIITSKSAKYSIAASSSLP